MPHECLSLKKLRKIYPLPIKTQERLFLSYFSFAKYSFPIYSSLVSGEMAEWLNALDSKSSMVVFHHRGFESPSLRQFDNKILPKGRIFSLEK